jgi:uncharacterized RDD family membrane protein YckC
VNRRVAAHLNRKEVSAAEPETGAIVRQHASKRAAEAAARVAARYANAPSYSEMLAGEALAALRAAQAVSKAALEAQAAAAAVLAGIEAASATKAAPKAQAAAVGLAELQEEQQEPEVWAASRAETAPAVFVKDWRREAAPGLDAEIAVVEPAVPIYANLIEFPRELVAPHKVRPRRAEEPYADVTAEGQLSIFEVDPGIADPGIKDPRTADHEIADYEIANHEIENLGIADSDIVGRGIAPSEIEYSRTVLPQLSRERATREAVASTWTGPEWSGIELKERREEASIIEEPEPEAASAPALELAPMNWRFMAATVDGSLIVAAVLAAGVMAASNASSLPGLRTIEVGTGLGLLAIGFAYQVLFFTLATGTPGMKYAHIGLRTLEGRRPTRAQRIGRLAAMFLSVLPLGLGIAWSLFDDQHLSWHDRLSRTYMQRY